MSYSMGSVTSEISDFDGYSLYATLQPGSNGDPYGDPTYIVGDDQGMENWGFNTWDSDAGNGPWDTGSVPVEFVGQANGYESLAVPSNPTITYNGDSFNSIGSVEIEAEVSIPAAVQWSDISVKFYSQGTLEETDTIASGPSVDTTSTPSSPQAQQILTIAPTGSNDDTVVVDGTVRITAPSGTVPGSTAMAAQVFVFNGS